MSDASADLVSTTQINANLTIGGALTTFPNYPNLTFVDGNITISGLSHVSLTELDGIFPLLETVTGNLIIQNNANVTTITGFDALTNIGNDFTVSNNASLSSCCRLLRLVDASVTVGGTSDVSSNIAGCNAVTEITDTCSGSLSISNNSRFPDNEETVVRITGDLTIRGAVSRSPDFRALEVVEGDLIIQALNSAFLTEFVDIFPRLTEVQGSIYIRNNTLAPLQTITGFAAITRVGGDLGLPTEIDTDLTIAADGEAPGNVTEVTRIEGNLTISGTITEFPNFAALKVVEGDLSITPITTSTLTTLDDIFPALDTILGDLVIRNQNFLQTIGGFAELDSIGKTLSIRSNSFTTISGFGSLDGIGGALSFIFNRNLTSLSDFGALKSVGGNVAITSNNKFLAVSGFGLLGSVGGNLSFGGTRLETISGFGSLTRIEGSISISANPALRSISGFYALTSITGNLTVEDNTLLSSCCGLLGIADGTLVPGGSTSIDRNAAGCNTFPEIRGPCASSLTITQNSDVPSNVESLTHITGDLTISGTITAFPNFAALEGVGGNLVISGITTAALTSLTNIFPALRTIGGSLTLHNDHIETISGFAVLDGVEGDLNIGGTLVNFAQQRY